MNRTPMIHVAALCKEYGGFRAVDRVSLDVLPGEIFGVIGPNGAGKTTTLEMMVGMRIPTAGSVSICGYDPVNQRALLTERVSIQPQQASLFDHATVRETLELFASFYPAPAPVDALLAEVGLEERAGVQVKRLSGGQRQRLLVAVALVGDTDVIFLDEPTGSLDPQARRQLWAAIRTRRDMGKTVVLTSHSMEEAQSLCDRVAIMARGRVLALGTPLELVQQYLPDHTITYEVPDRPDVRSLDGLPGVASAEVAPAGSRYAVRIRTTQPNETLRVLLGMGLMPAGGLSVEQGRLEDVYLSLVSDTEAGGKSA